MRTAILAAVLVSALTAPLAADKARDEAEKQVKFGIDVARNNLGREATFWFLRATEIDPTYGAAFNNLAIAYEHAGKLEEAGRAYERAEKLDPDNQYIKQNHELFKEIYERASRQSRR
jgi:Flp pilus assembly protein TadD